MEYRFDLEQELEKNWDGFIDPGINVYGIGTRIVPRDQKRLRQF